VAAATKLFSAFMGVSRCPGLRYRTAGPPWCAAEVGRARWQPDHRRRSMIVSVPECGTRPRRPETGASSSVMAKGASAAPSSRVPVGLEELISMAIVPRPQLLCQPFAQVEIPDYLPRGQHGHHEVREPQLIEAGCSMASRARSPTLAV